jgi:hypothetical protein
MTNTHAAARELAPEEIIARSGADSRVNFGGGQVDITSGRFVFSASEAYLIENGKVTRPVRGATLIGNGPEAMNLVSMVGNDLKLDAGIGVCGKDGQSVPVGVGQPTLRIDGLTVAAQAMRLVVGRLPQSMGAGVLRYPAPAIAEQSRAGCRRFRPGSPDALCGPIAGKPGRPEVSLP